MENDRRYSPGIGKDFPDPRRARRRKPPRREEAVEVPLAPDNSAESPGLPPLRPRSSRPRREEREATVFDRVAELERQVAELQAREAKRRLQDNASQQRWRESHR